jgi:hypothetical protein
MSDARLLKKALAALKTQPEQDAWADGWNYAGRGVAADNRPSYPTHEEREAFRSGWDILADRIAHGYTDDPQIERDG